MVMDWRSFEKQSAVEDAVSRQPVRSLHGAKTPPAPSIDWDPFPENP